MAFEIIRLTYLLKANIWADCGGVKCYVAAVTMNNAVQGGYAYIRLSNPTCEAAENAVNSIEGGFGSIVFGSGMAAISTTLLTFLHPGDHIVRKYKSYIQYIVSLVATHVHMEKCE